MEGNRLLGLLVTVSLVGAVGLFVYSLSLEPASREIGEIGPEDVGSLVSTDGMVVKAWMNSRGDLNLVLTDGEHHIRVYVPEERSPSEKDLIPGAFVTVKGEVQMYAGELEIFVTSPTSIRILKKSMNDSIPPGVLAEMPEVFAEETVRVHGTVQNIRVLRNASSQTIGTVFDLAADGYEIPCMVFGWDWEQHPAGVNEGSSLVFEATWNYYPRKATWQLVSERASFGT
ncbi:MAG: OB-fold nucleic acid binding domain-containing protein [Thermoplasmata archaeon]